ncbi:MAG TPA: dihydrolipoyl dehydrogenase [Chlamydiales bacterium]|nr:dihydrolipoyl dehydrogenase [Chlamydiales bacterium]
MENKVFDIAVIGAGPGGYVAAIKAAQLGKTVALIEKEALGGTCLNVGCIPTKTLIASALVHSQVKRAAEFGIQVGEVRIAYEQMKKRKDTVVANIKSGLTALIKANKITVFQGTAQFESVHDLKIIGQDNARIRAEKIIIGTGSVPIDVKTFPCDHERILNSTSILELSQLPKSLCVVGGGYIGCEFASLFAELGVQVTIVEALPTILAAQGKTIADFMTKSFTSKGIEIRTNVIVKTIVNEHNQTTITFTDGSTLVTEMTLVSIGRKPYTEGLSLEKAGLKTNERGFLTVNDKMETEVRGIYAIGDVTGKAMLAHVASHQGITAAMNACGLSSHVHYHAVPAVIFTSPEVATVGITQEEAEQKGLQVNIGTFPFQAIGKAQASGDAKGFSQVVADKKTGQILGCTIIGHDAANLIAEMALAIQNELTLESVTETIHAHPTMAEIWHEAAAMTLGTPIHLPPKRQ